MIKFKQYIYLTSASHVVDIFTTITTFASGLFAIGIYRFLHFGDLERSVRKDQTKHKEVSVRLTTLLTL